MDRGAKQGVHGVANSWTWLKRLSGSSIYYSLRSWMIGLITFLKHWYTHTHVITVPPLNSELWDFGQKHFTPLSLRFFICKMGTRVWGLEAKGIVCRYAGQTTKCWTTTRLCHWLLPPEDTVCAVRGVPTSSPQFPIHWGYTSLNPSRASLSTVLKGGGHKVFPICLPGGLWKDEAPWKLKGIRHVDILSVIKTLWHLTLW